MVSTINAAEMTDTASRPKPLHISLVRPPSVTSRHDLTISTPPPIGLAYLAAAVKDAGYDLSVVDAIGEAPDRCEPGRKSILYYGLSVDDCVARINSGADIVGVSVMFSLQWPLTKIMLGKIRERLPNAVIVLGGEHATALAEYSMEDSPAVDICALGEGESVIVDIIKAVENGAPLDGVAGIVFRKDGGLVRTEGRPRIKDIDSIKWPDWSFFPIDNYHKHNLAHLTYGVVRGVNMPILASRGCPYRCTFCSNTSMWHNRWTVRDPDNVIDEMQSYRERYGATDFSFYDLTAIVRKDWIIRFCNKLVERGMDDITWQLPTGTRSEALDEEACEHLYRTGCRYLVYAPESASEKTLELIQKKISLEKLIASMRAAISKGIIVRFNTIIGFPSEERTDIFKTLRFIVMMAKEGAVDCFVNIYSPYPGSVLFDELRASGVIGAKLDDDYFHSLTFTNPFGVPGVRCNRNIPVIELLLYRTLGYVLFYSMTYIFKPSRIADTIKNVLNGTTESAFENALTKLFQKFGIIALINRLRGGAQAQ